MNTIKRFLAIAVFSFATSSAWAQLQLPLPSPASSVSQVVGFTEVKIEYSSPAVKGRKVWGELVPYGEMWRTGANMATKVSFNTEVDFNGTKVPAGTYSFFTIPNAEEWTVIINSDANLSGTSGYDEKKDLVRVKVKPQDYCSFKERLAFEVENISESEGKIHLIWEKKMISVPFKVDALTKGLENVKNATNQLAGAWYTLAESARFYMENGQDLKQALTWAETSIHLRNNHFYNNWIKAQILAKQNNTKEAILAAKEAQKQGEASTNKGFYNAYKDAIAQSIKEWEKKK